MNPRLETLYRNLSVHATADREHEAAIELLLLVMLADHHISDDEIDAIRTISDESGFETPTFSFDQYLGVGLSKVRTAVSSGAIDELLDDIDGRIASSVLRQSLFSAAREVAGVDHEIDAAEESILGQVAARFG